MPLLFFHAAFTRNLFRGQKAPNGFVGVDRVAGLADLFLRHILLAARPRVAAALHAVEHDLGVVLAAAVSIGFRFLATFLQGRNFVLRRLISAAVELSPGFGTVFGGEDAEWARFVGAAIVRNDGIVRAIDEKSGHGP